MTKAVRAIRMPPADIAESTRTFLPPSSRCHFCRAIPSRTTVWYFVQLGPGRLVGLCPADRRRLDQEQPQPTRRAGDES